MKIYVDLLIITNFIFDFILLTTISIILKRNIKIYRIILGSLFGLVTLLSLFIRFNNVTLLLFKIFVGIILVLVTFGFKDIRYFIKNTYYLYMVSIIMGGLIYFINNQFDKRINIFLEILLCIICLYLYIKNIRLLKNNYNKYLKVTIFINDKNIDLIAFLDTGNKLFDPYFYRPIILVNKNLIKEVNHFIYVPFRTCNEEGILTCIKANKIYIEGFGYKKRFLIGLTDNINIDGINCILNERLLEG